MFKQRKHKTFNYQSRFSKENSDLSNSDINPNTKDFISKWKQNKGNNIKIRSTISSKILIIILVLLLICMYMLEKKYM